MSEESNNPFLADEGPTAAAPSANPSDNLRSPILQQSEYSSTAFSHYSPYNRSDSVDFHSSAIRLDTRREGNAGEYFNNQQQIAQSSHLRKTLTWRQLISLGVGCTIGAGIFVVTGEVAHLKTGPALFLSYIVSALACLLSAFSYAEFAAMSPTAGSAYGYARGTFGELAGMSMGWDLALEYSVAAASVAQGWSKYFNAFLVLMGAEVPKIFRTAPWAYDSDTGRASSTGSFFDFPAVAIVLIVTIVLITGIRESAKFNNAMVALKVSIVLFVIFAGIPYIKQENYTPFAPYGYFGISFFGWTAIGQSDAGGNAVGVVAGASIAFFSYIGYDAVTTNAEECKNPQRDLPIGIMGSLLISTVLYVAVSLVLVGMIPYTEISRESALSSAFGAVGLGWAEFIVAIGALAGLTSVLLVTLMGQPRILMAMARDGLLPESFFGDIHERYRTPYKSTALTGIFVALFSAFIPLSVLVELVSIGTLFAFMMVNISIIVLRKSQPQLPRPYRCPWVPILPASGAFVCFMLMISLPGANWIRLIVWQALGMLFYYFWGRHNAARVAAARRRPSLSAASPSSAFPSLRSRQSEPSQEDLELVEINRTIQEVSIISAQRMNEKLGISADDSHQEIDEELKLDDIQFNKREPLISSENAQQSDQTMREENEISD